MLAYRFGRIFFLSLSKQGIEYVCRSGPLGPIQGRTVLSPHGKYAAYDTPSRKVKIFELPRMANAVGELAVTRPFVIDDQGSQYGCLGKKKPFGMLSLDGSLRPLSASSHCQVGYILLQPERPEHLMACLSREWHLIDASP